MRKLIALTALLAAANVLAAENPEITVTATRVLVPIEHVGDDVDVITREEIERLGFTSISDVLRYVSAVSISRNGGPGKVTDIFMMGLPSRHVLVLVDGVPVNNPSLPDNCADFRFIDMNNVERIEVLKGSQGAIYGSDAIGGVINIITRKPRRSEFTVETEGGKYSTFRESLYGSLKTGKGYISISSENFKTEGFDAKNSKYEHDADRDGYNYRTGSISYGVSLTPTLRLSGVFSLKGGSTDYDDGKEDYDRYFTFVKLSKTFLESGEINVKLSDNKETRDDINAVWGRSRYIGITRYVSVEPVYYFSENLFISGGASYRYMKSDDTYSGRNSSYIRSAFAQLHSDYFGVHFTASGRFDNHKTAGTKGTYKLSASYRLPKVGATLKGEYGTGFKEPSLFQLYSMFGNRDLKPEKSEGWVVGISRGFGFAVLEADYFKNHVWNMIDWDPSTLKYRNLNRALTEGVELKFSLRPVKCLRVFGSYTHLRAKEFDSSKGRWERLPRRPEISYTVGADTKIGSLKLSLWAEHYSGREDTYYDSKSWTTRTADLSPFTVYNCYISYTLNRRVKFYVRGVNLTDKDYELAYGYNTMGRAIFAGVKLSFR